MWSRALRRRVVPALGAAVLAVTATAALPSTTARFGATTASPSSSWEASSDWFGPTGSVAIGPTMAGTHPGHVVQGGTYNAYAGSFVDTGAPASGVSTSSIRADVSALTAGQTAATMTSGSYTYGGTSYGYRTAALTAAATLASCSYDYTVSATDNAGNVGVSTGTAMVDRMLASEYHLRVDGPNGGGVLGMSIAPAGDVNGDGIDDVIIGRRQDSYSTRTESGMAYVVFGRTSTATIDLSTTTWVTNGLGFRIFGAYSGDWTGQSVAGAGDLNGDGKDDLMIGAMYADFGGTVDTGAVYVVWGKASTTAVDLQTFDGPVTTGYRIMGPAANSRLGSAVAGAGQVFGDAKPDLLMGAYWWNAEQGQAFLVAGENLSGQRNLANLNIGGPTGYRMTGATSAGRAGWRVANAGDVNGDGRDDALVTADGYDYNGRLDAGGTHLVLGKTGTATVDLGAIGSYGFEIGGAAAEDDTGIGIGSAGDVNQDGKDDIAISSYHANPLGRADAGTVYVIFGKSTTGAAGEIDLGTLSATAGYKIHGYAAGDALGSAVANVGDVNGDTIPDLLVSAALADPSGQADAGAAYVVFGKKANTTAIDLAALGKQGYTLRGPAAGAHLGTWVAAVGDVNDDGRMDFGATASTADPNGYVDTGQSFVFAAPTCG